MRYRSGICCISHGTGAWASSRSEGSVVELLRRPLGSDHFGIDRNAAAAVGAAGLRVRLDLLLYRGIETCRTKVDHRHCRGIRLPVGFGKPMAPGVCQSRNPCPQRVTRTSDDRGHQAVRVLAADDPASRLTIGQPEWRKGCTLSDLNLRDNASLQ